MQNYTSQILTAITFYLQYYYIHISVVSLEFFKIQNLALPNSTYEEMILVWLCTYFSQ